jgi:hypothetical protein
MAEDSGAFKTKSANSRQIPAFCNHPRVALQRSLTNRRNVFRRPGRHSRRRFLTAGRKSLRYPRISLIRCARSVRKRRERSHSVATAFPKAQGPLQHPCEGGIRLSMLPGFRFLFAAIVLSMSILIFGLGAAALLRAAHEEFASTPAWHATPETRFAQQNEASRPVLALLRVDAPVASDNAPADTAPPAIAPAPDQPEKIAALSPDSSPPEAAKPETPVAETSPAADTVPAQADVPASAETKVAAIDQTSSIANEAAPPVSEPANAPVSAPTVSAPAILTPSTSPSLASPEANLASTKIATLGGPPVTIPPPAISVAPDKSAEKNAEKKRREAARAKARRRLAQRARLTAQAPQPTDAFGQPAITVRSR